MNGRFSTTRLGLVSASKQQFTDFADLEQKNLCNLRNLWLKTLPVTYLLGQILQKVNAGFNATIKVGQVKSLIRRVNLVAGQTKAHQHCL